MASVFVTTNLYVHAGTTADSTDSTVFVRPAPEPSADWTAQCDNSGPPIPPVVNRLARRAAKAIARRRARRTAP